MTTATFLSRHCHKIVPAVVIVLAAVVLAASWPLVVAWFSPRDDHGGHEPTAHKHPADGKPAETSPGPDIPRLPAQELPGPVLAKLEVALRAYDEMRDLLAADTLAGIEPHARAVAASLREAAESAEGPLAEILRGGGDAAERLVGEDDLETARHAFGDLSKHLIAVAGSDMRLAEGWHVFRCPMTHGFPKWIQRDDTLENPYMGTQMLTCGTATEWTVGPPPAPAATAGSSEIAYYTCPMHPSVRSETPGQCPICGMDLTPVTEEALSTGVILVDEARRRRIGLKLSPVERRHMILPVRAVGEIAFDESELSDVSLRMTGWVQRLNVDETGQRVRRGQVLFTLYSPELYAAQLEYLNALRGQGQPTASAGLREAGERLARTAKQRLLLLGMPESQVGELTRRGEPWENVPILAPASGYVIEKNVVQGAQVAAGTRVYRIADLDRVWVDAQVYEQDLPYVRVGQEVEVSLPFVPGHTYHGTVDYLYPYLSDQTRTGKVRVVLPNPELELRPQMYADVVFQVDLGERLAVPESAVLYTGPRRLVFVDLGEGRLRPQEVELGARAGGYYEVKSGLEPGDVVVTSGNFLIASESRLRSASDLWEGGGHEGH